MSRKFNNFEEQNQDEFIFRLFEDVVNTYYEEIALEEDESKYTYGEMYKEVKRVTQLLLKKGLVKNEIVGILMEPSAMAIVAMLAIMKAGGTYVILDVQQSEERIKYIIKNSQIKLILKDQNECSFLNSGLEIMEISFENLCVEDLNFKSEPVLSMNDTCYILYTSGTTGNPKGVEVTHKGLSNYVLWAKSYYTGSRRYTFPLCTSLAFDLTITSIYVPLISGGKIVIYRNSGKMPVLEKIMMENKIDIIKLTPTHLEILKNLEINASKLKKIIVGGENLRTALAEEIYWIFEGKIEIYNEYGPTETVVGCTVYKYQNDNGNYVPIGKPINNMQIYILDSNMKKVGPDEVGEIYIGGIGVSKGYHNQKELTKDYFVDNIFGLEEKMYKTGDYGKILEDGNIIFCGRKDNQIKYRGYRIELSDIECQILRIKQLDKAKVAYIKDDNRGGYLCAFVVKKEEINIEQIHTELANRIPKYMIPDKILFVSEIPCTVNGKADVEKLVNKVSHNESEYSYNSLEKQVLRAWEMILEYRPISVDDNFFEIGGDSFSAVCLVTYLNEMGYSFKVHDLFVRPNIKSICEFLVEQNTDYIIYNKASIFQPIDDAYLFKIITLSKEIEVNEVVKALECLEKKSDMFSYVYNKTKKSFIFSTRYDMRKLYLVEEEKVGNEDELVKKVLEQKYFVKQPNLILVIKIYKLLSKRYMYVYGNKNVFDVGSFQRFTYFFSNILQSRSIEFTSYFRLWIQENMKKETVSRLEYSGINSNVNNIERDEKYQSNHFVLSKIESVLYNNIWENQKKIAPEESIKVILCYSLFETLKKDHIQLLFHYFEKYNITEEISEKCIIGNLNIFSVNSFHINSQKNYCENVKNILFAGNKNIFHMLGNNLEDCNYKNKVVKQSLNDCICCYFLGNLQQSNNIEMRIREEIFSKSKAKSTLLIVIYGEMGEIHIRLFWRASLYSQECFNSFKEILVRQIVNYNQNINEIWLEVKNNTPFSDEKTDITLEELSYIEHMLL